MVRAALLVVVRWGHVVAANRDARFGEGRRVWSGETGTPDSSVSDSMGRSVIDRMVSRPELQCRCTLV
jgi:hypothetical protein